MTILLTALLASTPADAKPSDWNYCSAGSTMSTSAQCTCLKSKGATSAWWGGYDDNVNVHKIAWDSAAAVVGTCFDLDAYLYGGYYTSSMEKQLIRHGENAAFVNTTHVTGATTYPSGQHGFKWSTTPNEHVIWVENTEIIHIPPDLIPIGPLPDLWQIVTQQGPMGDVQGAPGDQPSHIVVGDWNDDGELDATITWMSGEVWDLHGLHPAEFFTPPMGPPPQ